MKSYADEGVERESAQPFLLKRTTLHANFTNAANPENKKGDSEEPPFTPYSSASQMAAFTALCQPFRRAARFASSISGRNTRSTSLFSMMSSVES